ncbi:SagB family peptide dehydrogenase [Saccharothrix hoggarensis]
MELRDRSPLGTIPLFSLAEDSLLEFGEDGVLVAITRWGEFDLSAATPLAREALRRMALGPVSLENVGVPTTPAGAVTPAWTGADDASLDAILTRLAGSVVRSLGLRDGMGPLLSVVPVASAPVFAHTPVDLERLVRLSRFSALRSRDAKLTVESPSTGYHAVLAQPWAVRVAAALGRPTAVAELAAETGVPLDVVAEVVAYLVGAGLVVVADQEGRFAEDDDQVLGLWSYEELLFHVNSRDWRVVGAGEAVERPPAPLVKDVGAATGILLHRPVAAEPSPAAAPVRAFDAALLGELLFRTARVTSVDTVRRGGTRREVTRRPYYSVDCLYELELYVTVNRCRGLPRGIHHFDPVGHRLVPVNDDPADVAAMLDMAMVAAASRRRPAALISVTARADRMASVPGGLPYARTLLNLGALQQSLFLTAAALGLTARAVVVDAGGQVGRALKLDWPSEVGVGESILDVAR